VYRELSGKVRRSIDMGISSNLIVDLYWGLFFVKDIVVRWSIEKMDHWTTRVRRYSVWFLLLEDMTICLRTFTPIQVDNLNGNTNWFQEDVNEQGHAQMVDLLVDGLDPIFPVSVHS